MRLTHDQMLVIFNDREGRRRIVNIAYDDNLIMTRPNFYIFLRCKPAEKIYLCFVLQIQYDPEDVCESGWCEMQPKSGGKITPAVLPDLEFGLRDLSELQITLGHEAHISTDFEFLGDCVVDQVVDSASIRFYRHPKGSVHIQLTIEDHSYDYCVPTDHAVELFGKTANLI